MISRETESNEPGPSGAAETTEEPSTPVVSSETPGPTSKDNSPSSGSSSRESGERNIRGRGGYRQQELVTIPQTVGQLFLGDSSLGGLQIVKLYANYMNLRPKKEENIFQYRVDFDPDIESCTLRRRLFREVAGSIFGNECEPQFDGYSDARATVKTRRDEYCVTVRLPDENSDVQVKIKQVGEVDWGSFEMLRTYNLQLKVFLKIMGFYCIGNSGSYVHNDTEQQIGTSGQLAIVRGFRTSANIMDQGKVMINLEPCHKMMQKQNVLQYMNNIRSEANRDGLDLRDSIRSAMVGKLIVTGYNKFVYRVEDVDFTLNPTSTFTKSTGEVISYRDYFRSAHNLTIMDVRQPLLIAINNNKKKQQLREAVEADPRVNLIPELCNIAGLTERQRSDNRLKMDMIRACQVEPRDRVQHMLDFMNQLNSNDEIKRKLAKWGYDYGEQPVRIKSHLLNLLHIGIGRNEPKQYSEWPKVDWTGSFDSVVLRERINIAPELPKCHLIISLSSKNYEASIVSRLKAGLNKVGVNTEELIVERIREGDAARFFVARLRQLPDDAKAVIVVLPHQDKEKYDAIKKYCSVERGLISQVVTTKLLTDERRAGGAITKIGIQIAAKLGGEPWRIHFPTQNTMFCGYDTYHDTSQRGRSYGAFVASVNDRYSQFWSKADRHDKLDELSTQLANNVGEAMKAFKRIHTTKNWPKRIVIYRDGVSDGQIEHVFKVELESVKQKIKQLSQDVNLSFVIVNKRIGARFYMKKGDTFINPSVGCVVDHTVTRNSRFDFYLVSQHTRQGTVTPTYYNIIFETSGLNAEKHQKLAYSLCFLYYNWTGGVRVPALCQYAHKLAYLCGEHLHATPNARLDDRLHFL